MIPVANPRKAYESEKEEILSAMERVLDAGQYIGGTEVEAFESEFAKYLGVSGAVGVGSGTDALRIGLLSCGILPNDEVITVSNTAVATVAAIESVGAKPVLVDIDPATFNLDPAQLAHALTPKTKAVVAVHLFGQPVNVEAIAQFCEEHDLKFIEDCAQAIGAEYQGKKVGSFGDVAAFSFYPTKNLGALGDGGMIASSDPSIVQKAKLLREYGWKERYVSTIPGLNSRLDPIQAAILRLRLHKIDALNARRNEIADLYRWGMKKCSRIKLPTVAADCFHVYHLFVVRTPNRAELIEYLSKNKIGSAIHYPVPIHLQTAYLGRLKTLSLVETEKAAKEILSLPMHPELTNDEVNKVVQAISAW